MSTFKIGLLGLGGIGSGLARALAQRDQAIRELVGRPVELVRVAVRDPGKARAFPVPAEILTNDPRAVVDDPNIDLVVEAMGGEEPATMLIERAIQNGKHIVTPNKEVIAKHGTRILDLAARHNVDVHYEASVGGGIPLIAVLKQDLAANEIRRVRAIINGTTNYILTRMAREQLDFGAALAEAQRLGYAEPDPTNDVEGIDAAYKLAILATLAFRLPVRPNQIYREGITMLTPADFDIARQLGYAIKLLAIGRIEGDEVELRVQPALVPEGSLLAAVSGPFNAIEIDGDLTGRVTLQGRGAGADPTASALLADIIDIAQDVERQFAEHAPRLRLDPNRRLRPVEQGAAAYYCRLLAEDAPGALAAIAGAFAEHRVSIASLLQRRPTSGSPVAEVTIVTHEAPEGQLRDVIGHLKAMPSVAAVESVIRVEDDAGG